MSAQAAERPAATRRLGMIRQLLSLLEPADRRQLRWLLLMVLLMALLETAGVASVMPFLAVLSNPELIQTQPALNALYRYSGVADERSFLVLLAVLAFVALFAATAFKALTTWALLRFTHMRMFSISRRLVAAYLGRPYEWFLYRHSGDLGKAVLSEVQQAVSEALIPLMHLIAQGAVAFAMVLLLLLINPQMSALLAGGIGGIYLLIFLLLRGRLNRLGRARVEANRKRFTSLQEIFGGIKEVKFNGLELHSLRRFEAPARHFAKSMAAAAIIGALPRYLLEIIVFGSVLLAATLLLSTPEDLRHAVPLLGVYALAAYKLLPALQMIYLKGSKLRFAGPAIERLRADIAGASSRADLREAAEERTPLPVNQDIVLDGVSFSYSGADRPALDGISLSVRARSTVALVGSTGSGKSTTVDVLLGLLEPQQGRLLVDGQLVAGAAMRRRLQLNIGYVPQQIFLSDASIAENIAIGVAIDQINQTRLVAAARAAQIDGFIASLPEGYETAVGERGVRLSGGQRQRIGIARALYHDPQVLILDEATSALDTVTEQQVMDAIHSLGGTRTIILVAHRMSTIRHCDSIFLLDRGHLVASGTFDQLLQSNASFRVLAEGTGR